MSMSNVDDVVIPTNAKATGGQVSSMESVYTENQVTPLKIINFDSPRI